ncbi:unnamed protein product [Thlaspi arvense]|uniref:Phorbol-ester/DAG-type domain-containing protein n=1 Tax=Thlaspi arvense TaxID=13288 RepID=A0AAU9RQE8_THLAR|nr:unnamed protein product [Thlaspi arvense]
MVFLFSYRICTFLFHISDLSLKTFASVTFLAPMTMRELKHGSHECVFTSPETVQDGICNICFKDEDVEFTCIPCNFDLCKSCSNLPQKVSHEFHSEHPLEFCLRKLDQKPEHIICSGCGTMSSNSFYKCKECEIYLDLECALLPNIFRSWDLKEKLHYSHVHLLNRCRPGLDARGSCLLCELPLSPSVVCYGCVHCYSFVHEHCIDDLIIEIQHPVHPAHPLRPLDYIQHCNPGVSCGGCGYKIRTVPIGCLECKFYLHLRCADSLLRGLTHNSHHDHKLFYVATSAKNVFREHPCGICKKRDVISLKSYYHCVECSLKFHFECLDIPLSLVKKNFHIHPLVCGIFLANDDNYSLEYCGVCETIVHVGHHAYSCNECDFLATSNAFYETPSPLYLKDLYSCDKDNARGKKQEDCETNKFENKLMVNDVGHIHILKSIKVKDTKCTICCEKIFGISWDCESCEFKAHDYCANLGQPSRHRLHINHDLILLPSYPTWFIMNCDTCRENINGFNLFCRICNLITCIKCVARFNQLLGVLHKGQKVIGTTEEKCSTYKHDLFQVMVSRSYPVACTICDQRLCGKVLSCMQCGEIYHPRCIEVWSLRLYSHPKHSCHTLFMRLIRGFKCTACKLDIAKYGLSCGDCNVGFHIECSEGVVSEKNNVHNHTFYNFWIGDSRVAPACSVCGRSCGASFYGCVYCNFCAHGECLGFPAFVKSQKHQHKLSEIHHWDRNRCAVCRLSCYGKSYSCFYCKELFHQKCIMSMDDREAATEEKQLGDIYFMYIERLLLDTGGDTMNMNIDEENGLVLLGSLLPAQDNRIYVV